jgi:hypothetical protein
MHKLHESVSDTTLQTCPSAEAQVGSIQITSWRGKTLPGKKHTHLTEQDATTHLSYAACACGTK